MVSENNDFYDAKTLSPIDDHPGFQINKNTDVFFRVIYKEHSYHVRNPTHMIELNIQYIYCIGRFNKISI
jgi:hypothetical protein